MMPTVTIMIPTYNQARYIVKTVESALAQDYPNLEVVVSDDCSSDETQQLLQPFVADGRIRYYRNESNLGRVANYRRLLYELATTEWVINLDGDDYYTNTCYISSAMAAIGELGFGNVLFFQGTHVRLVGKEQKIYFPQISGEQEALVAKSYFFSYSAINYFSHMSTLYNRNHAIQNGFYELNIASSDVYSLLKLAICHPDKKAILSKLISGDWVQHESNASQTLHLVSHLKNYSIYFRLFLFGLRRKLNVIQMVLWYGKVTFNYAKMYVGMLLRKIFYF